MTPSWGPCCDDRPTFPVPPWQVFVDSLRTLHLTTAQELGMGNDTIASLEELLDELKQLLNGVSYLRELTPRTLDYLVSFGERLSVRIMAARLNQLGVPAQYFESWTLGLRTTSAFGKADVLPECYGAIRGSMKKLDDNMCVRPRFGSGKCWSGMME